MEKTQYYHDCEFRPKVANRQVSSMWQVPGFPTTLVLDNGDVVFLLPSERISDSDEKAGLYLVGFLVVYFAVSVPLLVWVLLHYFL
jgi:hypothetical protein